MKTVVVVSDTHGNRRFVEKLLPIFAENDYIIHLGDGASDMWEVYNAFPEKTFVCQGNCDFARPDYSAAEWEIEIENCRLFCSHGHKYGVKSGTEDYKREARRRGCNVALYGHTHDAHIGREGGFTLMNPGNGTPYSADLSYGYIVVNGDKVTATVVPVLV